MLLQLFLAAPGHAGEARCAVGGTGAAKKSPATGGTAGQSPFLLLPLKHETRSDLSVFKVSEDFREETSSSTWKV